MVVIYCILIILSSGGANIANKSQGTTAMFYLPGTRQSSNSQMSEQVPFGQNEYRSNKMDEFTNKAALAKNPEQKPKSKPEDKKQKAEEEAKKKAVAEETKRKVEEETKRKAEEARRRAEETKQKSAKGKVLIITIMFATVAIVLIWLKSCGTSPPVVTPGISATTNLWNAIDQLDAQKKVWDAQVSAVQGVTGKLYKKAMALTGGTTGTNLNVWEQINQMSQTTPPAQQSIWTTPTTPPPPEILNTISNDVKAIQKDLKEHRAGARASHRQAIKQRDRMENKIDNLDAQITLARAELIKAKEEIKQLLAEQNVDKRILDAKMENLRLRIEGLERLQQHK